MFSCLLHFKLQQWNQYYYYHYYKVSYQQVQIYVCVALILSVVELLNAYSMSILPGSLYLLLKGSDVGWSMILSCLYLRKAYTRLQILAAGLIMLGIAYVFAVDDSNTTDDEKNNAISTTTSSSSSQQQPSSSSVEYASLLCFVGAFLNALCSVGTEAMLKNTLRQEEERLLALQHQQHDDDDDDDDLDNYNDHSQVLPSQPSQPPSKLFLSNAYSMWTSFFAFVILALASLWKEERNKDEFNMIDTTATVKNDPPPAAAALTVQTWSAVIVGLLLLLLGVSRFLERLAKHFICVHDSAVTFSIVQAARRWSGIFIIGLALHEQIGTSLLVGSVVSGIGFALHTREATNRSATTRNDNQDNFGTVQSYEKIQSTISKSEEMESEEMIEMSPGHIQ